MSVSRHLEWVEHTLDTKLGVSSNMIVFHDETASPEEGFPITFNYLGDIRDDKPVHIRPHSACFYGNVIGSLACDCGPQWDFSMDLIRTEGRGIMSYIGYGGFEPAKDDDTKNMAGTHEGRAHGLTGKAQIYKAEHQLDVDTYAACDELDFEHDKRSYAGEIKCLNALGITRIIPITGSPDKLTAFSEGGIEVVDFVLARPANIGPAAEKYLSSKQRKAGHY